MLLLPGEIEHQGPLPMVREEQQGQADEIMENPARCRVLHWLILLIKKCGVMPLKALWIRDSKATYTSKPTVMTIHSQQRDDAFRLF